MRTEIQPSGVFMSAQGGLLEVISDEGEVVSQIAVPAGVQPCRTYLALIPQGFTLAVASGLAYMPARVGVSRTEHPDTYATAANPDFQPTSSDRLQRQMRAEFTSMRALRVHLEARERALAAVPRKEVIPDAPKQAESEGAPVVE